MGSRVGPKKGSQWAKKPRGGSPPSGSKRGEGVYAGGPPGGTPAPVNREALVRGAGAGLPEPGMRFDSREDMMRAMERGGKGPHVAPSSPRGVIAYYDADGNPRDSQDNLIGMDPNPVQPFAEGAVVALDLAPGELEARLLEMRDRVIAVFQTLEMTLARGTLPRRDLLRARALHRYLIGEADSPEL